MPRRPRRGSRPRRRSRTEFTADPAGGGAAGPGAVDPRPPRPAWGTSACSAASRCGSPSPTRRSRRCSTPTGASCASLVRAASGKHPEPPGGGPHVASPLEVLGSADRQPRDAVRRHDAVHPGGAGDRRPAALHLQLAAASTETVTVTLAYPFEPLTDYLIDVHSVPKGAPASATGLVHRIGFTTSRFDDVAHLARFVEPAAVSHQVALTPAALQTVAGLPDRPTGDQLDAAFQGAGLTPPQAPGYPAVQVVWSPDPTPQPIAVIVECSEPLWRARLVPTVVTQPPDASDPTHTWWAARPAGLAVRALLVDRSGRGRPAAGARRPHRPRPGRHARDRPAGRGRTRHRGADRPRGRRRRAGRHARGGRDDRARRAGAGARGRSRTDGADRRQLPVPGRGRAARLGANRRTPDAQGPPDRRGRRQGRGRPAGAAHAHRRHPPVVGLRGRARRAARAVHGLDALQDRSGAGGRRAVPLPGQTAAPGSGGAVARRRASR